MKIILFLLFVLSFSACESLKRSLKPLVSVNELSRELKKIAHQHELSIIENKDFDLVARLTVLSSNVKKQIHITEYNKNVLNDDYTHRCGFLLRDICYNAIWVKEEAKKLNNHREILEDIKQELSMLIEKIIVVKKVVKQIEERKKKEKKIIKDFTS